MQGTYILDATIRDGGYQVGFQFTLQEVATVVAGLSRAGFRYIEIGHGMGSGWDQMTKAMQAKIPKPAFSDIEELETAMKVVENDARLGVMLGASDDDPAPQYLDGLVSRGMKFVRFACYERDLAACFPRIEHAKKLGLEVSVNVMQTYAHSIERIQQDAKRLRECGLDWLYVVDSAGGMRPEEVANYVKAVKETGLVVGFHAHNDSGMGIANCLAAVDAGAQLIDGTLNGLGRGAGNVPTEQILLALQKRQIESKIDTDLTMNVGHAVRALWSSGAGSAIETYLCGSSRVHTHSIPQLSKVLQERNIGRARFYHAVADEAFKRGQLDAGHYSAEIFQLAAEACPPAGDRRPSPGLRKQLETRTLDEHEGGLAGALKVLNRRKRRTKKLSVMHVASGNALPGHGHPISWESADAVGCTMVIDAPDLQALESQAPDILIVDPSKKSKVSVKNVKTVLAMSSEDLLTHATLVTIQALDLRASVDHLVTIPSDGPNAAFFSRLRSALETNGKRCLSVSESTSAPRVLVGFASDAKLFEAGKTGDQAVVIGSGPELSQRSQQLKDAGIDASMPAFVDTIAARVQSIAAARRQLEAKPTEYEGVKLVAPLCAPAKGEVAVDDLSNPSCLLEQGQVTSSSAAGALSGVRASRIFSGTSTF